MKYLIDESLSPKVAKSLAIVGHVAESVQGQFGKGVKDAEIIRWCRDNEYVFVHADDRLRRTHRAQLLQLDVTTLLVHRSGGRMSVKDQLRCISYAIPKLELELTKSKPSRHYRVSMHTAVADPKFKPV
ncbi:MAG: hypothetical protein F4Y37_07955 [Caldilineaceae bacterium SB0664_bin_22]|nr:hypothetical protein [Caldilineaceae bacterium SB0664_bin_22]